MRFYIFFLLFLSTLTFSAQTSSNKTDDKGLKQGYWVKLNPNTGRPAYVGTFKDDKPTGVFKYFYAEIDTIHTRMEFRNSGTVGYATVYYMTGKKQAQGKYVNEKKDSTWTFYDESGKLLSTESYKDGKKEGKALIYYPNGEVSEERNFKNDLNNGVFKQFFEDKKLKAEGTYIDGKQVGKSAYYFPSGTAAVMGYYNDNGNRNGMWVYRDKDAKITSKDVYDNGKLLTPKEAEAWLLKNKGKEPKEEKTKSPKGKNTSSVKTPTKSSTPAKGGKK